MLGWAIDKGFELVAVEIKSAVRSWDDNAKFQRLAESFDLAEDLLVV